MLNKADNCDIPCRNGSSICGLNWTNSVYETDNPHTDPTDAWCGDDYDVTYKSTDACPDGQVVAVVKNSLSDPVMGIDIGFLLMVDTDSYSGGTLTDVDGRTVFEFTASDAEAGRELWCSMAVDAPNCPPSLILQVPCFVEVCE